MFTKIVKELGNIEEYPVLFCDNCDIQYIQPPENLSEYYRDSYFADINNNKSILSRIRDFLLELHFRNNYILSGLASYFLTYLTLIPMNRGRILDYGFGTGDILLLLDKYGYEVYGIDLNENAVKEIKKYGINNVYCGDTDVMEVFDDNFFDDIRAANVFEHLTSPIPFIKMSYKKLKSGGSLHLSTPNINSLGKFFGPSARYYVDIPRHVILYSTDSILKLLRKEGFKQIKVSYKTPFSNFKFNIFHWCEDHIRLIPKNAYVYLTKIIILDLIFLPVDIIFGIFNMGQTLNIIATK